MTSFKIDRRMLLAGIGAASLIPVMGQAQTPPWPQGRQLKIVVPFPPAGATDIFGRLAGERLGQVWGMNIIIENKPGAGGNIGIDAVAKYLYPKLTYDAAVDLAPISLVALVPNLLVVGNHVPVKSVAELIAYGKANPGKLTYGSSGIGTSVHLAAELFRKQTGVDMVHVPYRGSAQATQDLIGGRIDLIFDNITQALAHVRAGSIRALGITTVNRSPVSPEFVPIAETVPGYDVSSWFALFAPAKTPAAIITKVQTDIKAGLADPGFRTKIEALGGITVTGTPAELGTHLKAEMVKWGALIKELGLKVE
jgi:tripartite-type tricarboxylate transporter receptor subunit TctC